MYNYKDFGDHPDTELKGLFHADLADFMSDRMEYDKKTKCYYTSDMLVRTYVLVVSENAYDQAEWPDEFAEVLLKSRWRKEVFGPFEYSGDYNDHKIYYITPYCRLIITHLDRFLNPSGHLGHPTINNLSGEKILFIKSAWNRSNVDDLDGLYRLDQDFGDYFLPREECYWGMKANTTFFSSLAPGVLTWFFDKNKSSIRTAYNSPLAKIQDIKAIWGDLSYVLRLNSRSTVNNPSAFLELFYSTGKFSMTQHMLMWYAPILQCVGEDTSFSRLNNFMMNMQRGDYWEPKYFVGFMQPSLRYIDAGETIKENYIPNFDKFWPAALEHKSVARKDYNGYLLRINASW